MLAYVIDNEDGTFTVSYQSTVRGSHQITVTMRNVNINGSPFTVNVTGRMDFGKVGKVLACFGCEGSGGGKFALYMPISTVVVALLNIRELKKPRRRIANDNVANQNHDWLNEEKQSCSTCSTLVAALF